MPRIFLSFAAALLTTFTLFFMMESLVAVGKASIEKPPKASQIEFVRLNRDSELNLKARELPRKPPPKMTPSKPAANYESVESTAEASPTKLSVQRPGLDSALTLAGGIDLGSAPMDRDAVPIVRVEPMYPARAAQRNIEGWVLVEFSISKLGTVLNARVVRSEPGKIFNRAALKAVNKWKYKPKIDNGVAVETHGHRKKLKFTLSDD